jgi:hypothetical protein
MKTRVTKLFKTKNNGLIDSSKPGAAEAIREADRAGLLVADLGVYTAQEGYFPFGYLGVSVDSLGAVPQGAINFDFATVTVGSTLQITPTSTRAALRGVDSIIGNSNRLDQDTVFSARSVSFGVGTPDGDLLGNPAASDEAIAGQILHVSIQLGQVTIIDSMPARRAQDSHRYEPATGSTSPTAWQLYQQFPAAPLEQVFFPEDQFTIRLQNPIAIQFSGALFSKILPIRCYLSGVRYQRAAGV